MWRYLNFPFSFSSGPFFILFRLSLAFLFCRRVVRGISYIYTLVVDTVSYDRRKGTNTVMFNLSLLLYKCASVAIPPGAGWQEDQIRPTGFQKPSYHRLYTYYIPCKSVSHLATELACRKHNTLALYVQLLTKCCKCGVPQSYSTYLLPGSPNLS